MFIASATASVSTHPCPAPYQPIPPESSILIALRAEGYFADCYSLTVPALVTQAQFVEAFYTTPLFKAERFILRTFAAMPSTDGQATELAAGARDSFAAWKVTRRTPEQLLLRAQIGRSSSWLMAVPDQSPGSKKTTLFFGTAIVGHMNEKTGKQEVSLPPRAILALHDLYSRLLLQAAAAKLAPLWT